MLLIELHNPGSLHSFIHTWHESDGSTAVRTALRAYASFSVTFPEPCGHLYKIMAVFLGPLKYSAWGICDGKEKCDRHLISNQCVVKKWSIRRYIPRLLIGSACSHRTLTIIPRLTTKACGMCCCLKVYWTLYRAVAAEPWRWSYCYCCVLWRGTLLSQCLSSPAQAFKWVSANY